MPVTRLHLDDLATRADLAESFRSPAVELLDGRLVRHASPSATVVATVVRIAAAFDQQAVGLRVGVRDPVAAPPSDLLRPEVGLLRPTAVYQPWPAPPAHALALAVLVVERLDDAVERVRRYAHAGVREVWVVETETLTGVALAAPAGGRYGRRELLLPDEPCAPSDVPWLQVVPVLRPRSAQGPGHRADQSVSSSISNTSPSTSITSPARTRRFRRVST